MLKTKRVDVQVSGCSGLGFSGGSEVFCGAYTESFRGVLGSDAQSTWRFMSSYK